MYIHIYLYTYKFAGLSQGVLEPRSTSAKYLCYGKYSTPFPLHRGPKREN